MAQCLYDEGVDNKVKTIFDGAVYSLIAEDCVLGGTYNEFNENHTSSSLTMTIATGFGFIGGGFFALEDAVEVEIEPNSSNLYVVARIDKTKPNGQKASIELITEVQIKKENLNGSGSIRDLLLYKVSTDASGVSSVVDLRNIKDGASGGRIFGTLQTGETEITLVDARLNTNNILTFYTSIYGIAPNEVEVSEGTITLTFDAQEEDIVVCVEIEGNYGG